MSDLLLGTLFVAVTCAPILLGRLLRARTCAVVRKPGSRRV
jgi:hypothetical protein